MRIRFENIRYFVFSTVTPRPTSLLVTNRAFVFFFIKTRILLEIKNTLSHKWNNILLN
jgi:hypothetical protein